MPEFTVEHDFYRTRDVASLFSMSRQCVANWANLGKLESISLTSHAVLITGRSVKNWAIAWKR
jgi:hypothetical protein